MGLLPFPGTYEYYYSKAEAWGSCSPLYLDVHVVAVVNDWFVGVGVGVGFAIGVGVGFAIGVGVAFTYE